jgi:hypothetical protein
MTTIRSSMRVKASLFFIGMNLKSGKDRESPYPKIVFID